MSLEKSVLLVIALCIWFITLKDKCQCPIMIEFYYLNTMFSWGNQSHGNGYIWRIKNKNLNRKIITQKISEGKLLLNHELLGVLHKSVSLILRFIQNKLKFGYLQNASLLSSCMSLEVVNYCCLISFYRSINLP